jgi:hydroxyacylglutathione hydrolase
MGFSDERCCMTMLNVMAVPAFDDNYLWLIHDGRSATVIDPGDGTPILTALATNQLALVSILLTHHHADHVGGVPHLLQHFQVPVFGPRHDSIRHVTEPLDEGDIVSIPALNLTFSVLAVPGHTRGHIAYVASRENWLFCGDTLFGGGCGRLFEGTPAQMLTSLEKLAALPDETKVYCAHEYTLANLRFAHAVEPGNNAISARMTSEQAKRHANQATIPSSIGLEKATNPFLRVHEPEIIANVMAHQRLEPPEPVAVFAALREWKNTFK